MGAAAAAAAAAAAGQDGTRQTPEQRTEEISRDPVTGVGCSLLITVTLASRAADDREV